MLFCKCCLLFFVVLFRKGPTLRKLPKNWGCPLQLVYCHGSELQSLSSYRENESDKEDKKTVKIIAYRICFKLICCN